MPVINGQGYSGITPDKQHGLKSYLSLHFIIVKNIYKKYPWHVHKYYYMDVTCGSGINPETKENGSPIIFRNSIGILDHQYEAHFIDRESANIEYLKKYIPKDRHMKLHVGDNTEIVPRIVDNIPNKKWTYGLLYMDNNGKPDFELISGVSRKLPRVDILIRCPCTAIKRCKHIDFKRLTDYIDMAEKNIWLIRQPVEKDPWQWTFLFGTNYTRMTDWKKERFYRIDSEEGTTILDKLNYTRSEIEILEKPRKELRKIINDRSSGICEVCRQKMSTEYHHLRYRNPEISEDIIDVCHECHCKIEGKED